MKIEVKLNGLQGVLDTLKSLPPEVVSKNGGPVRVALRKGAVVIQKQAKDNFRAAVALPGKSGITDTTGFTERQIIVKRKKLTNIKGERYIVSVRYIQHPSGIIFARRSARTKRSKKPQTIRANDIAFLLEYGSAHQPATPWLRPAFESRAADAIQTVETELLKGIDRIVKKLAKARP